LYCGYDLTVGHGFVEDGSRERLEVPCEIEEPVEDCDGVLVSCTFCQRCLRGTSKCVGKRVSGRLLVVGDSARGGTGKR